MIGCCGRLRARQLMPPDIHVRLQREVLGNLSDEVWVFSLPMFRWTKVYGGPVRGDWEYLPLDREEIFVPPLMQKRGLNDYRY